MAWALADDRPFPGATLVALGELVPFSGISYAEIDWGMRTVENEVGDYVEDADDAMWSLLAEHPFVHRLRELGEFSAVRITDLMSRRELRSSRLYADCYRHHGVESQLQIGISGSRTYTRDFVLNRASGDFSDREVALLELIRPHLTRLLEAWQLRRMLGPADPSIAGLTDRECEVLELAAAGLSNADIAERLWIARGTVKKHLDNIYGKLGTTSRTAAAARVRLANLPR